MPVTNGKLVHYTDTRGPSVWLACNPGQLIATKAALEVYYGLWQETTEPVTCSKCSQIGDKNAGTGKRS